mgnify:CR=1 FL=1
MDLATLNKVATAMTQPGKGILAADESSGTIKKRFDEEGISFPFPQHDVHIYKAADD